MVIAISYVKFDTKQNSITDFGFLIKMQRYRE